MDETEEVKCSACGHSVSECGPMVRNDGAEWIGLKHLPKLGQAFARRQGGRL